MSLEQLIAKTGTSKPRGTSKSRFTQPGRRNQSPAKLKAKVTVADSEEDDEDDDDAIAALLAKSGPRPEQPRAKGWPTATIKKQAQAHAPLAHSESDEDDPTKARSMPKATAPRRTALHRPPLAAASPVAAPLHEHKALSDSDSDEDDALLTAKSIAVAKPAASPLEEEASPALAAPAQVHWPLASSDEEDEEAAAGGDNMLERSDKEEEYFEVEEQEFVREIESEQLPNGVRLCVSVGSALDFGNGTEWPQAGTAVVNAANKSGLGGDKFGRRGGEALKRDRRQLPVLPEGGRIPEGGARGTGPNQYGSLFARTVIHAVGPNYRLHDGFDAPDELLRSAYADTMREAKERSIQYLGFSLISAAIFRGRQDLETVLEIGIEAVAAGSYEGLREVHLVGFSREEKEVLRRLMVARREAESAGSAGSVKRKREQQLAAEPARKQLQSKQPKAATKGDFQFANSFGDKPAAAAAAPYVDHSRMIRTSPAGSSAPKARDASVGGKQSQLKTQNAKRKPSALPAQKAGADPFASTADEDDFEPAQSSQKRQRSSPAAPAPKRDQPAKKQTKKSGNKMQKAANSTGQQRLAFAAPLQVRVYTKHDQFHTKHDEAHTKTAVKMMQEGGAVELVATSRRLDDPMRQTSTGITSKNSGNVSLEFLLQQKQASTEAVNRRRSSLDESDAALLGGDSAALLEQLDDDEEDSAPLSDEDSDLDGGDDSEITEVDVWLGTFEAHRTGEWSGGVTMSEAISQLKKRLGKLHKWRYNHYLKQLRRGSGDAGATGQKFVGQRDVVMALMDDAQGQGLLLSKVERKEMAVEYEMLREVAVAAAHTSGESDTAAAAAVDVKKKELVVSEDMLSPTVLLAWVGKVEAARGSQINQATDGAAYARWLGQQSGKPRTAAAAPAPAAAGGSSCSVVATSGSQGSASGSQNISPPEKAPSPPAAASGAASGVVSTQAPHHSSILREVSDRLHLFRVFSRLWPPSRTASTRVSLMQSSPKLDSFLTDRIACACSRDGSQAGVAEERDGDGAARGQENDYLPRFLPGTAEAEGRCGGLTEHPASQC